MVRERSEFGDNRSVGSRSRSIGQGSMTSHDFAAYQDEPEIDYDGGATTLYRCIEGKDWDGALSRLELAPIEAKTWVSRHETGTDKIRWRLLPLHAVCIFRAPLALIEALIEVYAEGPRMKDDQGMLPIHLACRNGASKGVILTLLQAFPEALDVRDRKARLPVDLVEVSNSQNKENVLAAIRKYLKDSIRKAKSPPKQVTVDPSPMAETMVADNTTIPASLTRDAGSLSDSLEVDYEHRTVLFRMILKKDWKQAAARAAAFPEEAATWIVTKGFNGNLRFLPLHKACVLSPPDEEFGELLKAYPAAAESTDQDGWLPLHCACFYGAKAGVIRHLLKTSPKAAQNKDDEGRLPLHYACLKGATQGVVDALIASSGKAAMAKDQEGRLPLHHACSKGAPEGVIDALLKASPKGAQSKDDQGRLPLHHACRRNSTERVIRTLLRVYPRATQIKDDQDKLAIHYACNHGGSPEILQLLLETYPECINVKNCFGHTPLSEVQAMKDPKMDPVLDILYTFKKEHDRKAVGADVESQVSLLKAQVSALERALDQVGHLGQELKNELRRSKDPIRILDNFADKLNLVSSQGSQSQVAMQRERRLSAGHGVSSGQSIAQNSLSNTSAGTTPVRIRAVSKPKSRSATPGKRMFGRRGGRKADA
jgi:ankyrin repeat protein